MTPLFLLAAVPAAALAGTTPTPEPAAATAPAPQVAQAAPATPAASGSYPYGSLQLGIGFPRDYDGHIGGIDTDTTLELNSGFNGEAALGYKFKDFRTDLSVGYGNFGVNRQTYSTPGFGGASVGGQGAVQLWTVMANGYYDIPIWERGGMRSRWSPYIGAGIGYANLSTPACAAGNCYGGGSSDAFAWQGKVGVSYRASERGFAFLEGGYVGTVGDSSVDNVTFGDFGAWRINLGWRQGFGGAAKAQPVAVIEESAPAPQPVEAPQPVQPSPPIRGLW